MHNNNILCLRLHQEYILCILASMHSTRVHGVLKINKLVPFLEYA